MPRVTRSTRANPVVEERPALGELEGADVNSSVEAAPEPKKRSTRATKATKTAKGSGKENATAAATKSATKTAPAKERKGTKGRKVEIEVEVAEVEEVKEAKEAKEAKEVKEAELELELEPKLVSETTKDDEADWEADEQLKSLENNMRSEENVLEANELEAPVAQVTPEKAVPVEVKTISKTPKFDPDAHMDQFDQVGNDSFEVICSPRKRQSTLSLKPAAEKIEKKAVKATAPVVKKRPSAAPTTTTAAPAPALKARAGRASIVTAKPAANTSALRTKCITSAAPQSPKLEKRRNTQTVKPVESKRVVSGASTASTAATTRTRSVGIAFPPPPPPVRSSKPPTVPTFELPGEAFSRKAAAAREERRKRMEEEEKKRKQFKAKPVPRSVFKQHMKQHQERFGVSASMTDSATSSSPATLASTPEKRTQSSDGMVDTPDATALKPPATAVAQCSTSEDKQETESISSSSVTASDTFTKLNNAPLLKVTGKKPATVAVSAEQALRQRMKHRQQMEKDTALRMGLDKKAQAVAVLKTRKEAADKGREAVRMWAEMQKQKLAAATKKAGDNATVA